jgi:DNA uptake protein ComE-like DNA-binding protein
MSRKFSLASIGLVLAIGLAACAGAGAASTPSSATSTSASPTPTSTPSESSVASSTPSESAPATTKVNANSATVEELPAAFEAAGFSNADRWAREVAEYRPYPADPTWAQLRQELGKYNIGPAVLEEIIALLEV